MFRRKQHTWRHIYQTEEGKDIKILVLEPLQAKYWVQIWC